MFERHGRNQGQRDGAADAALNLPARPKPDLIMAVAFPGYRDSYLAAYGDAHRARRWREERRRAEELSGAASPAKQSAKASQTGRAFDQGWRDGYDGKAGKPPRAPEHLEAYRNGHRLGVRDRGYARARELRRERAQDHSFER